MALYYRFKDADIDKIIAEKHGCQKNPHNYAAKKTDLLKQKLTADVCCDHASIERLQEDIHALEERAENLIKPLKAPSLKFVTLWLRMHYDFL